MREHHARTLLIHFRWDVERVLELFVEDGKDKLFAAAGVKILDHSDPFPSESCLTCDICIEDKPAIEFTAMDCGHYFCNECKIFFLFLLILNIVCLMSVDVSSMSTST